MHEIEASTPTSRRAMWASDIAYLVDGLRRHADEPRGDERMSRLHRMAYIHGLSDLRELPDSFTVASRRIQPHKANIVTIPKSGPLAVHVLDALAWHKDQDVRAWGREAGEAVERMMPLGPLLFDPVTARIIDASGTDEYEMRRRIVYSPGFGRQKDVKVRIGAYGDANWAKAAVCRNEIHMHYTLNKIPEGIWNKGHLIVRLPDMPETILFALRGRPLGDLIGHRLFADLPDLRITSISRRTDGLSTVSTTAVSAKGMRTLNTPAERTRCAA